MLTAVVARSLKREVDYIAILTYELLQEPYVTLHEYVAEDYVIADYFIGTSQGFLVPVFIIKRVLRLEALNGLIYAHVVLEKQGRQLEVRIPESCFFNSQAYGLFEEKYRLSNTMAPLDFPARGRGRYQYIAKTGFPGKLYGGVSVEVKLSQKPNNSFYVYFKSVFRNRIVFVQTPLDQRVLNVSTILDMQIDRPAIVDTIRTNQNVLATMINQQQMDVIVNLHGLNRRIPIAPRPASQEPELQRMPTPQTPPPQQPPRILAGPPVYPFQFILHYHSSQQFDYLTYMRSTHPMIYAQMLNLATLAMATPLPMPRGPHPPPPQPPI